MLFSYKQKKNKMRHHAWLYSAVFAGRFSTLLIFILFASFAIQPFHKAIAAEPLEGESESAPVAEEVKVQEEEVSTEPVPDVSEPEAVLPPVDDVPTQDSQTSPVTDSSIDVSSGSTEDTQRETEDSEMLDDGALEVPKQDSEVGNEESSDEKKEAEDAKSTVPKKDQVVQVESLVTEDNFYQFSKQSCVAVGDGTYHCSTSSETAIDESSVVYSERGEDGNMEIFLRTSKNNVKQITDNGYDDTSPHYDAESMRIVWQRLVDGRYQIVLYDIMEEEESQLTFSKTNNMEPKVSSSGIVWQAWDTHDWEIMFFDGSYTEQLTENDAQDVTPVVQDGYVLWNVLGGEEQQAKVYSIDTKEIVSIEGYEGGAIVNPRFVLVYDTMYENGDVVTQSFDPATGISEPVAARPAPEPVNIPDSDPVGEIRALITNKSKDEKLELDVDDGGSDIDEPQGDGTLNLKSPEVGADPVIAAPVSQVVEEFELTEYDLVIPEGAFEEALQATASSTQ